MASGWAFLVPYLGMFLVYYWRHWPANGFSPDALGNGGAIPALRHVFGVLHVGHALVALVALRSWWRSAPSRRPLPVLHAVAPWILLALFFAIPGAYLEWPADPWEHLYRINEWQHLAGVDDKLLPKSFSYFFAFSFVGGASGLDAVGRVPAYLAALSLLLSWQYFRLARAAGVSGPAGVVFVLLQAVLAGNNVFSFHRYYGLASTMLAQLAVIAVLRVAVTHFNRRNGISWRQHAGALVSALVLLVLIALNHVQGLGIAALGLASIVVCRCLGHCRWPALAGLAVGVLALNIALVAWQRSNPVLAQLVQAGWLNRWFGFDLLSVGSPPYHRALEILGLFGLINLGAAFFLLRSHPFVAALTLLPVAGLCLPVAGVPFVLGIGRAENVILFHRLLLGVPVGLALAALAERWFQARPAEPGRTPASPPAAASQLVRPTIAVVALAALVVTPASHPYHCRLWNGLQVVPADLRQADVLEGFAEFSRHKDMLPAGASLLAPRYVGYLAQAAGFTQEQPLPGYRLFIPPGAPSAEGAALLSAIDSPRVRRVAFIPSPLALASPQSAAGQLSGHWSAQQVHLERAAAAEAWDALTPVGTRVLARPGPVFILDR